MSEKRISEREAVLRERDAYETGIIRGRRCSNEPIDNEALCKASRIAYPLPQRIVPRIVKDPVYGFGWRYVEGVFQFREGAYWIGCDERPVTVMRVTAARVALWADLLANPTTTEDDPGHE